MAWNSVRPRRRLLEMSYTPPTDSVCSPWMPLAWMLSLSQNSLNSGSADSLGILMCTEGGAQVGRAEGQVAEAITLGEGQAGALHLADALDQTGVDLAEVAALLHGDDAEVILLVHPDEEGLVLVVEDATAVGPVVVAGGG